MATSMTTLTSQTRALARRAANARQAAAVGGPRKILCLDRCPGQNVNRGFCSYPKLRGNLLKFKDQGLRAVSIADEASNAPVSLHVEYSGLVNKELILFLMQLELDSQLQRALNYENFIGAKEVRQKRNEVDDLVAQVQASKGSGCGVREASSLYVTDFAAEGLRLRTEMQRAVEDERYGDAAQLRDQLKQIEAATVEASAAAAQVKDMQRKFRLGQRVVHATKGYRAVVCGWDAGCCESEQWKESAGLQSLRRGPQQRFYHLLVDTRDWKVDQGSPAVTYVAEELLVGAEESGLWEADFSHEAFQHPYCYLLFLGKDGKGDLVPTRQLRDKYNAMRRDVYYEGSSADGDSDTTED